MNQRHTYLNGQHIVRNMAQTNDDRPRWKPARNVVRMRYMRKRPFKGTKTPAFLWPIVNKENEPRYVTRARLLRERREQERGLVPLTRAIASGKRQTKSDT